MEPAALQRMSEMKKFLRLLLQIDIEQVRDLQLSLDADHVWRQKKNMLEEARNDPSESLDFRRECCDGLTNRHSAFGHIMAMK